MDTTPHWLVILLQTVGELAIALVALPFYVFMVLPKHDAGELPGFSPVIADGVDPVLAIVAAIGTLATCIGLSLVLVRVLGRGRTIFGKADRQASEYSPFELVPGQAAASFAEEFLFRVVCVDLCGFIVASLLFTAAHFDYWKQPLRLAEIFVVGLLLGVLYVFTQSLLLCALVHFAYNLVVTHLEDVKGDGGVSHTA